MKCAIEQRPLKFSQMGRTPYKNEWLTEKDLRDDSYRKNIQMETKKPEMKR